jgi:hypothetical protein
MVRLRLELEDEYMHDSERISNFDESMVFDFDDTGREIDGHALSEYLDQIVDGAPVGVAEEDGA